MVTDREADKKLPHQIQIKMQIHKILKFSTKNPRNQDELAQHGGVLYVKENKKFQMVGKYFINILDPSILPLSLHW